VVKARLTVRRNASSSMSSEGQHEEIRPVQRPVGRDLHQSRVIAAAGRRVAELVFTGWAASLRRRLAQGIEAQIAAAALGYKPLYFDPWPETEARRFARLMRRELPVGVCCESGPEGLFIFRPEVICPILLSDAAFYGKPAEDMLTVIRRLTRRGENGELLGYGARSLRTPGAVRVQITDPDGEIFMGFVAEPDQAAEAAAARGEDIAAVCKGEILARIYWPS
jgi:hypothetical protein